MNQILDLKCKIIYSVISNNLVHVLNYSYVVTLYVLRTKNFLMTNIERKKSLNKFMNFQMISHGHSPQILMNVSFCHPPNMNHDFQSTRSNEKVSDCFFTIIKRFLALLELILACYLMAFDFVRQFQFQLCMHRETVKIGNLEPVSLQSN